MDESDSIFRVLDASLNRVNEGFRTLEEAARFVLNDALRSERFKQLRHDLTEAAQPISRESLLRSRDTTSDVGTEIEVETEYTRQDLRSVVVAASARVQQSLRVLEEYSKVVDSVVAKQFEQVRYRAYTECAGLELALTRKSIKSDLQDALLYVLIDGSVSEQQFEKKMTELINTEVDIFQLRDRSLSDRALLRRAKIGVAIARDAEKLFIVNDRADIALAADADGVHVGQDELPVSDARKILGPNRLIGVSTHHLDEAKQAAEDGADYIGCGPVFPSQTKQFDQFVGVDLLQQVAAKIKLPAFAIGGIDLTTLPKVIQSGFTRVAVANVIQASEDPRRTATEMKVMLQDASIRAAQSLIGLKPNRSDLIG